MERTKLKISGALSAPGSLFKGESKASKATAHLRQRHYAPYAFAYRPRSLKELEECGLSIGFDIAYEPEFTWIAEEMISAELPEGWAEHPDEEGHVYYYNDTSGESSYEHPNAQYYKDLYQQCLDEEKKAKEKSSGATSSITAETKKVTVASRLKAHEEEMKKLKIPSRRILHEHREQEQKRAEMRKEHLHEKLTTEGIIGPKDIIDAAKKLGIQIGDHVSHKETEYFLLKYAAEYVENMTNEILPHPWQVHEDYFYNWETEESTYDDPREAEALEKIVARRKEVAAHPMWPQWKGDRVDQWWAFTTPKGDEIFYYNFMTGDKFDLPPDIGLKNALAAQRGIRSFIARKRVEKKRFTHVLELAKKLRAEELAKKGNVSDGNGDGDDEKKMDEKIDAASVKSGGGGADELEHVVVGGKVFNKEEHKEAMANEELRWEMQKKQAACIKELEILCAKADTIEFEKDNKKNEEWWTNDDYQAALKLVIQCANVGLAEKVTVLKGHEEGHAMCNRLACLASRYESEEGRRRALATIKKKQEEQAKRNACRSDLMKYREVRFDGAKYRTELNGYVIDHPSPDAVLSMIEKAEASVLVVKTALDALPSKDRLLTDENMAGVEEAWSRLEELHLAATENVDGEMQRRTEIEAREEAKAIMARKQKEMNDKLDAEQRERERIAEEKAEKERLEKKKKEENDALIADQKKRDSIAEERARLARELEEAQKRKRDKNKKQNEDSFTFQSEVFSASREEKEAEEVAKKRAADKIAYEEEVQRIIAKRRAEKNSAAEALERRKREQEEAEKERLRKIEEEHGKEFLSHQIKFEEEKKKREDKKLEKIRILEEREALRKRMIALMDEDEDDTEEEKRARMRAVEQLQMYEGGPFRAARDGNMPILKAFFLRDGTARMLDLHDRSKAGGGRTLLHTACWWGNDKMVRFLVKIGADINAIDTAYNRFTPLFEAVRGGRSRITKFLIQHGANIRNVDFQGNTIMHWAARRGWGAQISSILRISELYEPGSTKGLLLEKNFKGKTPDQVCRNETKSVNEKDEKSRH
eukprot:g657.t1